MLHNLWANPYGAEWSSINKIINRVMRDLFFFFVCLLLMLVASVDCFFIIIYYFVTHWIGYSYIYAEQNWLNIIYPAEFDDKAGRHCAPDAAPIFFDELNRVADAKNISPYITWVSVCLYCERVILAHASINRYFSHIDCWPQHIAPLLAFYIMSRARRRECLCCLCCVCSRDAPEHNDLLMYWTTSIIFYFIVYGMWLL